MGTELAASGVPTPSPLWSAWALIHRPDAVTSIHRAYARAGADVHTANTFRVQARTLRAAAEQADRRGRRRDPALEAAMRAPGALVAHAVALARKGAGADARIAGSIAPLEDCYRPDRSPRRPWREHRAVIEQLVEAGVELLLCETFPHVGEALVAVEEAVATGLPTWLSLTPGPRADLLTPRETARAAERAARLGIAACLVNCLPVEATPAYLDPLRSVGVPYGVYANALGRLHVGPRCYADWARRWVRHGVTIVGGCCGVGPAHLRALAAALRAG